MKETIQRIKMLAITTTTTTSETTPVQNVVDSVSQDVENTTSALAELFQPLWNKLPSLIFAVLFLALGYFIVKQIMRILSRGFAKSNMDGIMASFLKSVIKIALYVLLVVVALSILSVPMDSIVAVIASAGVAVGLALKDSLSNLAGGFIILFSKPLSEGDTVEVDGVVGKVESISILYTRMVTPDNKTVYIPNGVVSGNKIINYTKKELRRVDLFLGIGYENDIDKARQVLLAMVKAMPDALQDPTPEVLVSSQDESAVTLRLNVWTKSENYWALYYALMEQAKKTFDKNGISIPFPQIDVHLPEK